MQPKDTSPAPIAGRIWRHIEKTDTCWLWTGYKTPKGYGLVEVNRRSHRAHRVMYELMVGPIPDGLQIDHLCRVRHCVNPAHMEPVTTKTNLNRGKCASSEKTHCPRGHPYSPENTRLKTKGGRLCATCYPVGRRMQAPPGNPLSQNPHSL